MTPAELVEILKLCEDWESHTQDSEQCAFELRRFVNGEVATVEEKSPEPPLPTDLIY